MKMKDNNIILFMALKNCLRDKKKYIILVLGVSITIGIIIISTSTSNYVIRTQVENTKQITGDWHMAFLYDNRNVISDIRRIKGIKEVYQCFCIPDVYSENESECFQVLGINKKKINQFIKLKKGKYPKGKSEILVPQWYLDKNKITQFPFKMYLYGNEMYVVGSFDTDYQKTINSIPIYLTYEDNKELWKYAKLQIPWGSMIEPDTKEIIYSAHKIVLVALQTGSNIKKVESNIEKVKGVFPFPLKEAYGITDYSKEQTPWFNGELISVENFRNAGEISKEGLYVVQKKMNHIYELVILLISMLFMITFINLKKRDTLFQSGILQTMGLTIVEIIGIELVYLIFVVFLSIPIGIIFGIVISMILKTVQYINIGTVIIDILFISICATLSGILVIAYSIIINPVQSIRGFVSLPLHWNYNKRQQWVINEKRGFKIRYALRNIGLHKQQYLVITSVVALLFSLFVISSTIINLIHITGNGKSKYVYDFLIEKESDKNSNVDIHDIITNVRNIKGCKEILAPLCYDCNITKQNSEEIIVKIPKAKLTDVLKQKLSLSNYDSYVNNKFSYVLSNTGIVGCDTQELNSLKRYVVEGDIDKMFDANQPYVLLPKYFESYENNNIAMTKFKVGDSIELCVTKQGSDVLNPKFSKTKKFIIAGFVDINPFYTSNGVSSEFSVILNSAQLNKIVPGTVCYLYIKANKGLYGAMQSKIKTLNLEAKGYSVKNSRDNSFNIEMNKQIEKKQNQFVFVIIIGTGLIIIIGLANLIYVKKMMRKEEIKLLRIIGFSAKMVRSIDLIETIIYNLVGVLMGWLISVIIIKKINLDVVFTCLQGIPWDIWTYISLIILVVSTSCSFITSCYIEAQLDID
jgi:ABC-type lipoprotein release transport system permease subunit